MTPAVRRENPLDPVPYRLDGRGGYGIVSRRSGAGTVGRRHRR